jgi:hypothetical protein
MYGNSSGICLEIDQRCGVGNQFHTVDRIISLIVGAIISELIEQSHDCWQDHHADHDEKQENGHIELRIDLLETSIQL